MPGEVGGEKTPVQLIGLKEAQHQSVAVAADGVQGVGFGQLHQAAQKGQTVPALFQHVAQQNKAVVGGEPDFVHQSLEKGQIAVDVADGDDAPARREMGPGYDGLVHRGASFLKAVIFPSGRGAGAGGRPAERRGSGETAGQRPG